MKEVRRRSKVNESIRRLRLWKQLYDSSYISHHFVIWNYDGEAQQLVEEVIRLRNKVRSLKAALEAS